MEFLNLYYFSLTKLMFPVVVLSSEKPVCLMRSYCEGGRVWVVESLGFRKRSNFNFPLNGEDFFIVIAGRPSSPSACLLRWPTRSFAWVHVHIFYGATVKDEEILGQCMGRAKYLQSTQPGRPVQILITMNGVAFSYISPSVVIFRMSLLTLYQWCWMPILVLLSHAAFYRDWTMIGRVTLSLPRKLLKSLSLALCK